MEKLQSFQYLNLQGATANEKKEEKQAEEPSSKKKQKTEESVEKKEQEKQEQHYIETVLYWMITCLRGGDVVYYVHPFTALLPHVIKAQHHPDPTCSALAKYCVRLSQWALLPPTQLKGLVKLLKDLSKSPSWHVRSSAASYLTVMIPRHALVMVDGSVVKSSIKLCTSLLQDTKLEVRNAAKAALAAVLCCTQLDETGRNKLIKRFMKLAKTKVAKKGSSDGAEGVSKRHAGVLGLSTFVTLEPYDVPEHLPSVLAFLADHVNDPAPIRGPLRTLFAEFKRTHKDEWHIFKEKFTEDELEALNAVVFAPTYFA